MSATLLALALALTLVVLSAAAAAAQNFGGGPVEERYFKLGYETVRSGSGATIIRGSIRNTYDLAARNVQLLVEALDAAGRTTATARGYVTGDVPAEGSRVFEVRAPGPAASYQVKVLNWDWLSPTAPCDQEDAPPKQSHRLFLNTGPPRHVDSWKDTYCLYCKARKGSEGIRGSSPEKVGTDYRCCD